MSSKLRRGVIGQIHTLARERRVRFTLKALRELWALELGLDEEDVIDLLCSLRHEDRASRFRSIATGEWMHVFKPVVSSTVLYLKLVVRLDCIVISFHEDEGARHEEED